MYDVLGETALVHVKQVDAGHQFKNLNPAEFQDHELILGRNLGESWKMRRRGREDEIKNLKYTHPSKRRETLMHNL